MHSEQFDRLIFEPALGYVLYAFDYFASSLLAYENERVPY